jgi:carbon monoxide dehydrogenase subunit G
MATIRKDILTAASPDHVWDALRDVGAVHERVVPGFVLETTLEDGARVVTFANGLVAREIIVTLDDDTRRLAYAATGGRLTHHNASVQVHADPDGSRIVWTADLLPDELAPAIDAMMDDGVRAMKQTFDRAPAATRS